MARTIYDHTHILPVGGRDSAPYEHCCALCDRSSGFDDQVDRVYTSLALGLLVESWLDVVWLKPVEQEGRDDHNPLRVVGHLVAGRVVDRRLQSWPAWWKRPSPKLQGILGPGSLGEDPVAQEEVHQVTEAVVFRIRRVEWP